jgi:hypothetical protein
LRLRPDIFEDIRVALTATALATMSVISIDALISADEPRTVGALELWLLASIVLALGRFMSNIESSWRRSHGKVGATVIVIGAGRVGRLTASRLLANPEFDCGRSASMPSHRRSTASRPARCSERAGRSWDPERRVRPLVTSRTLLHDAMLPSTSASVSVSVRSSPRRLSVPTESGSPMSGLAARDVPDGLRSSFAAKYARPRLLVLVAPVWLIAAAVAVLWAARCSIDRIASLTVNIPALNAHGFHPKTTRSRGSST